jgi:tRNA A22 N-methylase
MLGRNNIERQEKGKRSTEKMLREDKLTIGKLLWEKGDPNIAKRYFEQAELTPEEIKVIKEETTH